METKDHIIIQTDKYNSIVPLLNVILLELLFCSICFAPFKFDHYAEHAKTVFELSPK